MGLEPEQERLLEKFVEAHRRVPAEQRGPFVVLPSFESAQITFQHRNARGVTFKGIVADAEVLASEGLLHRGHEWKHGRFFVVQRGIEHYEASKKSAGAPATAVEQHVTAFLDDAEFRSRHAAAHAKWKQACDQLWGAESRERLTAIGHDCREGLQEFCVSSGRVCRLSFAESNTTKTRNRMREVVAHCGSRFGEKERAFLDALLSYWDAVDGLAQRQEHGAQKGGEELTWEDARRLVFQTAIVMYEIDRAVARAGSG